MNDPRTMQLAQALVANTLSDVESRELALMIEQDPGLADDLRGQAVIDSLLRVRYGRVGAAADWRSVVAALHSSTVIAPEQRGLSMRWVRWVVPFAAAAGIVAMLYFSMLSEPRSGGLVSPATVATVSRVDGAAFIVTPDGTKQTARAGDSICEARGIATPVGGQAEVVLKNGARISMDQNTEAAFLSIDSGDQLWLRKGNLYCEWIRSPASRDTLSIRTPGGFRASVVGTKFALGITGEKTRLAVEEGEVLLASATASASVKALQMVEGENAIISKPAAISPAEIAPWRSGAVVTGNVVWRFDKGMPAGIRLVYGDIGVKPVVGSDKTALSARSTKEKDSDTKNAGCVPLNYVIPDRPFDVIIRGKAVAPEAGGAVQMVAVRADGLKIPAFRCWTKPGWTWGAGRSEMHNIFMNDMLFHVLNGQLVVVRQYAGYETYKSFMVLLENADVEEIEVRILTDDEVGKYRDPASIVKSMTYGGAVKASELGPK